MLSMEITLYTLWKCVFTSFQISLGVVKADPASAKGVVQILKRLKDYVPMPHGLAGEPFIVPCHGDQLSCERMTDARFAMGTYEIPANRLKGLEPIPGEFHHRCLTLQVILAKFSKFIYKLTHLTNRKIPFVNKGIQIYIFSATFIGDI